MMRCAAKHCCGHEACLLLSAPLPPAAARRVWPSISIAIAGVAAVRRLCEEHHLPLEPLPKCARALHTHMGTMPCCAVALDAGAVHTCQLCACLADVHALL